MNFMYYKKQGIDAETVKTWLDALGRGRGSEQERHYLA